MLGSSPANFFAGHCNKDLSLVTKTVRITNKLGLHARPSAKVVQTASQFESDIMLEKEGLEVNGKSIMGIMMLAYRFSR